jgi:hypothetical protein
MNHAIYLALAASAIAWGEEAAFELQPVISKVESPAVNEASGLAISSRDPAFMWIVNDSGAKPVLELAGTDGTDRGRVTVDGARNVDWEDISSFKLGGVSYLLIAGSGDNNSRRESCTLYIVEEPALPKEGASLAGNVKPAWTISYGYEDGPRDCEAVAVDVAAGKIILISKRTKPPMVYEMPLRPKGSEPVVAKKVGETSVVPPKGVFPLPYIAQPTGLDISADGSAAAVVTYYGVFLFSRTGKESWAEALAKAPVILKPHGLHQAESIAFSRDGKWLTVVSEGVGSPIVRYRRR